MRASRPDPERWSDRRGRGASAEDVVGAAMRRTRAATVPSAAVLARLEAAPVVSSAVPRERWALTLAFALGALLVCGGTVSATRGVFRAWFGPHNQAPVTSPVSAVRRNEHVARIAEVESVPPAAIQPAAVLPAAAPPARRLRAHAVEVETTTPPVFTPTPDPATEEAALVARAFRNLRTDHAPAAALAVLDDRERRFPAGTLGDEARVARAEALIALGRGPDALSLVDGVEGAALPRSLRLARAELRSGVERCADATIDFDAVLGGGDDDALGERALYGRASCRLTGHDAAGARSDLQRLLNAHGDGRFATEARRALERLAPAAGQ